MVSHTPVSGIKMDLYMRLLPLPSEPSSAEQTTLHQSQNSFASAIRTYFATIYIGSKVSCGFNSFAAYTAGLRVSGHRVLLRRVETLYTLNDVEPHSDKRMVSVLCSNAFGGSRMVDISHAMTCMNRSACDYPLGVLCDCS
jgi:hypothetical protein